MLYQLVIIENEYVNTSNYVNGGIGTSYARQDTVETSYIFESLSEATQYLNNFRNEIESSVPRGIQSTHNGFICHHYGYSREYMILPTSEVNDFMERYSE